MDSAHSLEQPQLTSICEPPYLLFLLKRGLNYIQQGCYVEGMAILALVREQLPSSQVYFANVLDAFLQGYSSYQRTQQALQEVSTQFAEACVELQARATLFRKTLLTIIQDLETSHLAAVPLPDGDKLETAPLAFQDVQGPSFTPDLPVNGNVLLPELFFICFNRFEVRLHGKPIALCPSRAGQSILRYLVTKSGHSATSDILQALFWSEDESHVAQRKLHHAISSLRASLKSSFSAGPVSLSIVCKNGTYSLQATVKMRTDVDEFLDCYHAGQQRTEERVALYEKACHFYTGPFLTEDIYDDWSVLQREQLSKTYFAMSRVLMKHYLTVERYEDAAKWAMAILKENPCDETAHQQLIQIYAAQGCRSEAIQQYHQCERILREELGMQPMLETTAILQKILLPTAEHQRSKNGEKM